MRSINAAGLSLVKESEGLRLKAYPDPGSGGAPWTIGYGSTSGVKKGMVITEAQAEALLLKDLAWAEAAVEKAVTVPLNDNQFSALVSFTFNLGEGNLRSSTLLKKLNAGDYTAVPSELRKWVKASGKTLPGLVTRRNREGALFMTAVGAASAPPPSSASSQPTATSSAPTASQAGIGAAVVALGAAAYAAWDHITNWIGSIF